MTRPRTPASARATREGRRRRAGRSGSSSASRSSHREEDDGEDGEPAAERERVRAHEAVLREPEPTRAEAEAACEHVERPGDHRPLERAAEPAGERVRRPVPDPVVELVPVELLHERARGVRREYASHATAIPASPSASASPDASHSCASVGSTSGAATGSSQSVIGCQNGANWIQPPTTDSTASVSTVHIIENGPSRPWWE